MCEQIKTSSNSYCGQNKQKGSAGLRPVIKLCFTQVKDATDSSKREPFWQSYESATGQMHLQELT